MAAFTEFRFSRRIQQTRAYKGYRLVDEKIATGRCGSVKRLQNAGQLAGAYRDHAQPWIDVQ